MYWVSGASGLVGSHIVGKLAAQGLPVRAIYRTPENKAIALQAIEYYWGNTKYHQHIEWFKADLLEFDQLKDSLKDVETIYHCAAFVSFQGAMHQEQLQVVNHDLTEQVVDLALELKIPRLVYLSSTAVLNTEIKSEVSETDFAENAPSDGYALSKWKAELEVWRGAEEGLSILIVNPSVVLGTGNINQSSNDLFKKMKNSFPFYSKGVMGFVDVRDVAEMTIALDQKKIMNERYVLGGQTQGYKNLFTKMANAFGSAPPKWEITPFLAKISWRVAVVLRLFGMETGITKQTATKSQKHIAYNSQKVLTELNTSFRTTEDTVAYCAEFYRNS